MSSFSYALGVLVLVFVLLRQIRVRPVRRVFQPRLPLFLGVIGFFEMLSYVAATTSPPPPGCGCSARCWSAPCGWARLRGVSMRVWPSNGWVVRQANARHHGAVAGRPGALRR